MLERNHKSMIDDFHRTLGCWRGSDVNDHNSVSPKPISEGTTAADEHEVGSDKPMPSAVQSKQMRSKMSEHGESTGTTVEGRLSAFDHEMSTRSVVDSTRRVELTKEVETLNSNFAAKSSELTSFTALYDSGPNNHFLRWFAPKFEIFIAVVIALNMVVMGAERQYHGSDIAYRSIGYRNFHSTHDTWPGASQFFSTAEIIFGSIFAAEVCVMLFILRRRFFTSLWQWFDASIVFFWFITLLDTSTGPLNPMLLRFAKLMRLMRLLRLIRAVHLFEVLNLMVTAVSTSFVVVFWSLIILFLVIMVGALIVSHFLEAFIANEAHPLTSRTLVFEHWGTFTRSLVTMFELTLGNWGPPCRLLQDHVSDWWIVFFLGYKCIIGFAVVQVITSVFIQQTFKCVAVDEQVMLNEKAKATGAYLRNLESLFSKIDVSGDGFLSPEEANFCLGNKTVQTWFAALDIELAEAKCLFVALDDGSGMISPQDFIDGIKRYRTPAKSIDCQMMRRELRQLMRLITGLGASIQQATTRPHHDLEKRFGENWEADEKI
eukprot:TRINITY_DN56842_c0_g1_i1.p1 TRINITY_DN56842_c0_g1~~TRINITY_DN56842_c0_g1_i1.p1  ORF type:complete len:631 (+),score=92.33 TRINITY_DN56842_c0_g1_i1:259-1893(+)